MRFLLVFLALHISPIIILLISLIFSSFGSLAIILFGESLLLGLQIGAALLGLGLASLFSGAFIWFQTQVTINNKIGGVFTFSGSAGAQVFLSCASQFIEMAPHCLPYTVLASLLACTGLLGLAVVVARICHAKQDAEFHETRELMEIHHVTNKV